MGQRKGPGLGQGQGWGWYTPLLLRKGAGSLRGTCLGKGDCQVGMGRRIWNGGGRKSREGSRGRGIFHVPGLHRGHLPINEIRRLTQCHIVPSLQKHIKKQTVRKCGRLFFCPILVLEQEGLQFKNIHQPCVEQKKNKPGSPDPDSTPSSPAGWTLPPNLAEPFLQTLLNLHVIIHQTAPDLLRHQCEGGHRRRRWSLHSGC